jgi:spore coat protein U-like protein
MRWCCGIAWLVFGQSALAAPTCTVSASPSLSFGPVIALASTADVDANSGASFWVNCTSEVVAVPNLYSGSARAMLSGANQLPFELSLFVPGGSELPGQFPGATLDMVNDDSNQTVTLHGRLRGTDFRSLPAGEYNQIIELTVEY